MRGPSRCVECGRSWWPFGQTGRLPERCDECDPESADRRASYQLRNARGVLYESALLEMTRIAEGLDPMSLDRLALRRAITCVAHARGPFAMRDALLRAAALCVTWASRLPIDAKDAA